jgi:hypothetical protein
MYNAAAKTVLFIRLGARVTMQLVAYTEALKMWRKVFAGLAGQPS